MFKKLLENLDFNVNKINFIKRENIWYLDIEIPCDNLDEITQKTKTISTLLDDKKVFDTDKEYYLNVFSTGTEQEINIDDLKNHINENVFIEFQKTTFNLNFVEGYLMDVWENEIILKINLKGLITKKTIEKKNIKFIKKTAKIRKD